ncbi:arsenate reductase (glutaredoxin) [Herbaspirillum seropedicae]|uniref:arsenate reductase (glutaredoxin) n=1 Tax=Herbaspirillum seropedicae TaxID=964 RepID=UPI00285EBFDA|nr:arsenate reductase (glutaredoxin) [Herbaspirillum seropedicae]MDR6397170.1 arsenate reductase [Herbaspirillum seropedicae]
MSNITIYHNPKCGTSRNVLQGLRDGGVEPTVIEYLKNPPDRATLEKLIRDMGVPVLEVVRTKEALYKELGLDAAGVSDAQLIEAMLAHPILINRPIVVAPKGTMLVRPSERLKEIFP